jgi:hypothetical protein
VVALLLPLVVRGRFSGLDLLAGAGWVLLAVAAHAGLADVLASTTALDQPRGAIAGSILGALLAVGVVAVAPRGALDDAAEPAPAGRALP